jgi:putative ABC transport system permease protein
VALGASRYRLVRQLFAESAVLGLTSAVAGVLMASWASHLLVNQLSIETGRIVLDLSLDWRTAMFASGVAIASVVICGVIPAFRASGVAPIEALKQHGQSGGDGGGRTADLLVVAQVSLSLVLVVVAALLVRTFASLATRDLGFARERILLARIDSQRAIADPERRMALYERVREIVARQPAVADVALSAITPVSNLVMDPPVNISGANVASTRVYSNAVSAHWLEVYGIPVVAGRGLRDTDALGTTPVAVVNDAFARRFFGAASPIDQFVTLPELMVRPSPNVPLRIVGIVADSVYVRLRELPQPTMYMPMVQHQNPFFAELQRGHSEYSRTCRIAVSVGARHRGRDSLGESATRGHVPAVV